jgi:hypothetical protein
MHSRALKLNRGALQLAQFRNPQAMPEGNQNHCAIALSLAIAFGSFNQPFNLKLS